MIKITKTAADRIDITVKGEIDADDMRDGLDSLIAQSEDITQGKMLYTITGFTIPTFGAFGVEFVRLPKLFGLLSKFDRCAVVSETPWLRTAAEIEGAMFPNLDIKSFPPTHKDAAEAWLEQGESLEVDDMDPNDNMPV